ncbi:hypothetical protein JX266_000301 [Neoarthrinium moseri]|nr:hypothetical protein JX266_000301 [Neoarthrinium moseri]
MYDFSQYGTPSKEWLEVSSDSATPHSSLSVVERQEIVNKMETLSPMVRMVDHNILTQDQSSLKSRSYTSVDSDITQRLPVALYLQGGGFLTGTITSEDAVCSRIAINTGIVVLNVCYRHTPQHTYPVAWNDTHDAFEWLHDHIDDLGGDPQQVMIIGISSGAYLAASFVLEEHLSLGSTTRPPIAGQILMVPSLINVECYGPMIEKFQDPSVCSLHKSRDAPLLSLSTLQVYTVRAFRVGNFDMCFTLTSDRGYHRACFKFETQQNKIFV